MKTNRKLSIFIVDSNLFYLNLYEQSLKNSGYNNISTFINGNDCVNALTEKPNIIFLDSNLENNQSSEILRSIKMADPRIYVVMIIDPGTIKTTINTSNFGISDYIIKGEDELLKVYNIVLKLDCIINTPKIKKVVKMLSLI